MTRILWILFALFLIAWLIGLGGMVHLAAALIWLFLVVALVLAVASLLTGRSLSGRNT